VNPIQQTIRDLKRTAQRHPSVVVAFSGGKDSLVVLDLCCSIFKTVKLFQMVLVPGLESFDVPFKQACQRYSVTGIQHPHWITAKAMQDGLYCDPTIEVDDLPDVGQSDMWRYALHELKADLIATGEKKTDSLWRQSRIKAESDIKTGTVLRPLLVWNQYHVKSYAKTHQIEIPDTGRPSDGIDFNFKELIRLHERNPRDFARICEFFPYAEAVLWRQKFYRIPEPVSKVHRGGDGSKPAQESRIQPADHQRPGA
jgi:phosphoadenosine phosphosulfate reductase